MVDIVRSRWLGPLALVLIVVAVGVVVAAPPAATAPPGPAATTLVPVAQFGSNPGNLLMYAYRPAGLASGRPLVVALHGCTQNASDYFSHAGWPTFADRMGFTLVLPEQRMVNNFQYCFNWFAPADTTRGSGETLSIKQMVDYAVQTYGADPQRVYITGLSAGAAMTNVLLAAYPDVFAGGAVIGGLAYRCAVDLISALGCMTNPPKRSPQQWGDAVRNADPGYTGPYPRVSIWHGTADTTVFPVNADRERDQWTDVWQVGQDPSATTSLPGGATRYDYGSPDAPAVSVYLVTGMSHGTPVDPGADPDQCGTAGKYYLDTICSSYRIAVAWGLGAQGLG
jgi:poly(hydroxyalkanoate) depolymerase family esterase